MTRVAILTADEIKALQKAAAREALSEFVKTLPRRDTLVIITQPEQYSKGEAACLLGISRTTLYTRINEGKIRINGEGKITREEIDRCKNALTFSPQGLAALD